MINREVRADGRCHDISGRGLSAKVVYQTRGEALTNSIQWPDQEPYPCVESGDQHWHCRTIEKHVQREVAHQLATPGVPITRILSPQDKAEERRTKIQALVDSGVDSVDALASAVRVSKATIRKDLREMGTSLSTRSDEVEDRREEVSRLQAAGRSVLDMAHELTVSPATIRKDLKYLSLTTGKSTDVEKRRDQVVLLAHDGKSPAEMAQELKVSIFTIRKDLKARNLTAVRKRRMKDTCGLPHRRLKTEEMFKVILERLEAIEKLLI